MGRIRGEHFTLIPMSLLNHVSHLKIWLQMNMVGIILEVIASVTKVQKAQIVCIFILLPSPSIRWLLRG